MQDVTTSSSFFNSDVLSTILLVAWIKIYVNHVTFLIYFNTSRTKKLGFLSLRCHFWWAVGKVKVTGRGGGINAKSNLKDIQKYLAKDIIILFFSYILHVFTDYNFKPRFYTLFNISCVKLRYSMNCSLINIQISSNVHAIWIHLHRIKMRSFMSINKATLNISNVCK